MNRRTSAPPNAGNESNQHWLSVFILKGFGLPRNREHVYTLDKQTSDIDIRSVDDVASKIGLLTNLDNNRMSEIEGRINNPLHHIRKGKLDLTTDERKLVDELVLTLILADPYEGVNIGKLSKEVTKDITDQMANIGIRNGLLVDRQRFKDSIQNAIPRDFLTLALEAEHGLTKAALQLMGLRVHKAPEPIVLGDSPVLIARAARNGKPSLTAFGSEIALPIAYNSILIYDWSTPPNTIAYGPPLTPAQIQLVRQRYCHPTKGQFVFSRTKEALHETRNAQQQASERSGGTSVPSWGWALMQEIEKNAEVRRQLEQMEEKKGFERSIRAIVALGNDSALYDR